MPDIDKVAFDEGNARKLFAELALRLESFDSFESIPEHIRAVLQECLSGSGFEFTYADDGPAFATGERFIKIQLAGRLLEALSALRTMQGNEFVGHG